MRHLKGKMRLEEEAEEWEKKTTRRRKDGG